jgi:hypothetical protein
VVHGRVATGGEIIVSSMLILIGGPLIAIARRLILVRPRLILIARRLIVVTRGLRVTGGGMIASAPQRLARVVCAAGRADEHGIFLAAGWTRDGLRQVPAPRPERHAR